jgi:plasmid stabilization system protein ParE
LSSGFAVRYTERAREDLLRLFDFLLDRAETDADCDDAQAVIDTIVAEIEGHLSRSPFIFRKAAADSFLRELVVPCRRTGYVVLYEIEDRATVTILAVRHQREDDYH